MNKNVSKKIHLNSSSILKVPLKTYNDEFIFIVNGQEFKTTRLISDLLSPIICQIHENDPTCDNFTINTTKKGNFSFILNLVNFDDNYIPYNEFPFIYEVIKILGNESIDLDYSTKITVDNVFSLLREFEQNTKFYSKEFQEAINFISSNFYDLYDTSKKELLQLSIHIISEIINNPQLQLTDEDQLLTFLNQLYLNDSKYSVLYEYVYFDNISSSVISDFLEIYDFNDITSELWRRLSIRMKQKVKPNIENEKRYKKRSKEGTSLFYNGENLFNGIINHFQKQTNGQITKEIKITASTCNREDQNPQNATIFNDPSKYFASENAPNTWIRYEFKNNSVIPTDYSIRSISWGSNYCHPKDWVIEGSKDGENWEILDEQSNCSYLNGRSLSHTFKIKNTESKEFRFIQMRQTGSNWKGNDYLLIESFELYGTVI